MSDATGTESDPVIFSAMNVQITPTRDQMRWQAMVAMATGYANCSAHDNPAELAVACRVAANALLAEWDYACEQESVKGGTT